MIAEDAAPKRYECVALPALALIVPVISGTEPTDRHPGRCLGHPKGHVPGPDGCGAVTDQPGTDLVARATTNEAGTGRFITDIETGRSLLKGRDGDRANAVLTAAGYNFRLVLKWLRDLLAWILAAMLAAIAPQSVLSPAS